MAEHCVIDIVDKYVRILNEHRRNEDFRNANNVYVHMCSQGLDTHISLENYLVPLFVKCGSLPHAQQVFQRLRHPNEHSWTSLIDGYVGCGHLHHAFKLYMRMNEECMDSSGCTSLCLLRGCNKHRCINVGMEVHTHIAKEGYDDDLFVASSLMDLYATSGFLAEAEEVFDEILVRDIAMWNVLISGYVDCGLGEEALLCLEKLESEGLSPSPITIVSSLKACSSIRDLTKGQGLFSDAIKRGFFDRNGFVGNTLVDMFASFGRVEEARCVFDTLPVKDMVTWNALISGYAEYGFSHEALDCFIKLNSELDLQPDSVTFYCCLKACGNLGAIEMGQRLHTQIIEQDLVISTQVGSALVYMYAKSGWVKEAQEVFASLHVRDLAAWNALINGYADYGPGEDALLSLELMQREGEAPDACTFTHCLKACSNIASTSDGRYIHSQIVARGFESDSFLGNALLAMYGDCCLVGEARGVFDKLTAYDTISWNAMIAAYAENGLGKEALDCYNLMRSKGCAPNAATLVAKLKACGAMGAIEKGREAHAEAVREGYYVTDPRVPAASTEHVHVSTALIDMYGKCGSIADARDVFDEMPAPHLVAWNALLSGYTSRGMSEAVLELFERMRGEGLQADGVTFLALLTACCRTGSLRKGEECFEAMSKACAIRPSIKHYNCIADLLCRAGRIGEAVSMIEGMPVQPDQVTWNIVLGSCQSWGDVEIGREAFARSTTMMLRSPESGSHSAFVLMSNLCTTS